MPKSVFKILDEKTGQYWNGNPTRVAFNSIGQKWGRRQSLERDLLWYLTTLKKQTGFATLPESWRIVEVELVEKINKSSSVDEFMLSIMLKAELSRVAWRFVDFYNRMEWLGVIDHIAYILLLRPEQNERFVSLAKILDCRAKLRLLGVKTRTFREYSGMFGMMDREQAMRAKLALDLESSVDLSNLREKVQTSLNAKETALSLPSFHVGLTDSWLV